MSFPDGNFSTSIWPLILGADPVVKIVMALLLLASIWSWTIIFFKGILLRRLNKYARQFERNITRRESLENTVARAREAIIYPHGAIFMEGIEAWQQGLRNGSNVEQLRNDAENAMSSRFLREIDQLQEHLPFLATVGSVSPFLGLFGTVWGIMGSFRAVAEVQNTSLLIVAPGIAEALLATAMGLFAAIPAVIFYNKLSTDIARYSRRVEIVADAVTGWISHSNLAKA